MMVRHVWRPGTAFDNRASQVRLFLCHLVVDPFERGH